jgi:hypothetical protein
MRAQPVMIGGRVELMKPAVRVTPVATDGCGRDFIAPAANRLWRLVKRSERLVVRNSEHCNAC